ncbi:T-cell activation inhibitor, mitochondrial isoform X2 [Callorhinchus milii]|nr:T-cell activation inhibitor, mitochondrial isoform X2 [Callorhinchus milii]|eukprot:gi/632965683/ref/XP_007899013.1/ PREDICTED: T-cell activation inhibitor, mitochondrial isoform X2 [Callorhinchus milii]
MQDLQTAEGLQQRRQQQQQTSAAPFCRPLHWNKTFYAFTGHKDPEEELEVARQIEPILGLWLDKNIATATKKLNDSVPLRDELDCLKSTLCQQLELLDVRWHRSWGVSHRCSQLHSLSRFAQQNSHALQNMKGCTLIFTDHTGMNAAGQVMLGTVDVHYQWTKLLERLPSYYNLHSQVSLLEERISYLLGDVQLIYDEDLQSILMLEDYYTMLKGFHQRVSVHRPLFHPRSLKGLQMILDNDCSAPKLLESGQFSIPTKCDPIVLQWFIVTHAEKARKNLKRKEELKVEEEKLIRDCTVKFGLYKLYKESGVSSEQMVKCCQRLFEEHVTELQGTHLCVSHFYSVLQDGDLCIPWDWKK